MLTLPSSPLLKVKVWCRCWSCRCFCLPSSSAHLRASSSRSSSRCRRWSSSLARKNPCHMSSSASAILVQVNAEYGESSVGAKETVESNALIEPISEKPLEHCDSASPGTLIFYLSACACKLAAQTNRQTRGVKRDSGACVSELVTQTNRYSSGRKECRELSMEKEFPHGPFLWRIVARTVRGETRGRTSDVRGTGSDVACLVLGSCSQATAASLEQSHYRLKQTKTMASRLSLS